LNLFRSKEKKYLDLINFMHKEYLLTDEIYDTRKTHRKINILKN